MKKSTICLGLLAFMFLTPFLMGAGGDGPDCDSSNRQDSMDTRRLQEEARAQAGMPAVKNFQEKKIVKMLYELRDQENVQTYTYIVAEMTGKLVFVGRSIGYGIPYAVEYTNPENEYHRPQPEPNGLFMPSTAEGTWILMVTPKGDLKPVYFEPRIVVSPFELQTN